MAFPQNVVAVAPYINLLIDLSSQQQIYEISERHFFCALLGNSDVKDAV